MSETLPCISATEQNKFLYDFVIQIGPWKNVVVSTTAKLVLNLPMVALSNINFESLSYIIRMCLYWNSQENKLLLQSELMAYTDENFQNTEADLHSLAVDYDCLDYIIWLN